MQHFELTPPPAPAPVNIESHLRMLGVWHKFSSEQRAQVIHAPIGAAKKILHKMELLERYLEKYGDEIDAEDVAEVLAADWEQFLEIINRIKKRCYMRQYMRKRRNKTS